MLRILIPLIPLCIVIYLILINKGTGFEKTVKSCMAIICGLIIYFVLGFYMTRSVDDIIDVKTLPLQEITYHSTVDKSLGSIEGLDLSVVLGELKVIDVIENYDVYGKRPDEEMHHFSGDIISLMFRSESDFRSITVSETNVIKLDNHLYQVTEKDLYKILMDARVEFD